ncbi:hypothetical protein [Streptomyces melanogenes]|uniref:Secreted protein n=1 Tax=Streptomyces melanogenes TaxID=67326 RepID=A0ABZ1XTJ6_9ACTN|nr:hypothetical protein [Streptomyces melanogenes]
MNALDKLALMAAATVLAAGFTAAVPAVAAAPAKTAKPAAECGVRSDGRLYCGNKAGAKGYADRSYRSATRGQLNGTFSWFQCWGPGDPHQGQNNIWYWTQLDNGQWGNVPAVDVNTGQDPAPGLREC